MNAAINPGYRPPCGQRHDPFFDAWLGPWALVTMGDVITGHQWQQWRRAYVRHDSWEPRFAYGPEAPA